jgi:hypothetical protein
MCMILTAWFEMRTPMRHDDPAHRRNSREDKHSDHSLLILAKKLGRLERKEHIITIPKKLSKIFPNNSLIEMIVGDCQVPFKIDSYGRMNPAHLLWVQFVELLGFDPDTDVIVFKWKTPEKRIIEVAREHFVSLKDKPQTERLR